MTMSFPLPVPRFICRSCRTRLSRQTRRHASSETKIVSNVPAEPVRTRFAPSPTGYLHLGSVRTALFNYLIAKRTNGQFLLRIEDTDTKRTIPGAEQRILDDLRWAGLQWDEGPEIGGPHGPYRQSDRTPLYKEHAQKLIDSGHAYRCFCSSDTLHGKAEERSKLGLATLYDRTCYHMSTEESDERCERNESFVVRLKAEDTTRRFHDIVFGLWELPKTASRLAAAQGVYDDFILLKADGLPTYHLANVVDDHHMRITHVIRGLEWQISTPKHLSLYNAFGWTPPAFGHIGLLLNEDGSKMSKRDKTFDIGALRSDGILPEALLNFLALHGWSHSEQQKDFMSLQELESSFNLNLSKTSPMVSLAKLWFLMPKHAMARVETGGKPFEQLVDLVLKAVQDLCAHGGEEMPVMKAPPTIVRSYVASVLVSDAKNYKTALDFAQTHSYFFLKLPKHVATNVVDGVDTTICLQIRDACINHFSQLSEETWKHHELAEGMKKAIEEVTAGAEKSRAKVLKKDVWKVLRAFLTRSEKGPSLVESMEIMGRDVVLERLRDVELPNR